MTTAPQLRRAATSLPEVVEGAGARARSYTVRGRPFASLSADGARVELRLAAADVETLLGEHPSAEQLLRGSVVVGAAVPFAEINGQQLNHWVRAAWKHRAPKRLAASAEAAERAEPGDGDLPRAIGRPATRALAEAGITTLDGVARLADTELASLHGVGPRAVAILRHAIAERS